MPIHTPLSASPGNEFVVYKTGNGSGSVGTKIRKLTTAETYSFRNDGTDAFWPGVTPENGAQAYIIKPGIFEISYTDGSDYTGAAGQIGLSLNAADLTLGIGSISSYNRLALADFAANTIVTVTRVVRLAAGDFVRPHHSGHCNLTTAQVMFAIRKVGNA